MDYSRNFSKKGTHVMRTIVHKSVLEESDKVNILDYEESKKIVLKNNFICKSPCF
jgi:hypothetical protein